MLTKKKKEHFRSLLNGKLKELLDESRKASGDEENVPDESFDFVDQASAEYSRALMLRMKERNSRLARKIMEALERLDDDTFGVCDDCGGEISEKRLNARPTANLCIRCKEKQEHREKMRGL